jgi:peroxiredoxin Q/BCP
MAIQVGETAPDFSATCADGRALRLSDFRGQKAVVLFFYPADDTLICTKEACAFRDSYEAFVEAGAEVIGISGDSDASHQAFAGKHHLPFHLISDADGSLRKLFGVPRSLLGLMPGRTTYVIDKQGVVRLVFTAALASQGHVDQALAAVKGV